MWGDLAATLARTRDLASDRRGAGAACRWRSLHVQEREIGDEEAAVDAYREALELDPRNSEAVSALERLYTRLDRPGGHARHLRAPAGADRGLPREGEDPLPLRRHLGGPLPERRQRRRLHRGRAGARPHQPPGDQGAGAPAPGPGAVGGPGRRCWSATSSSPPTPRSRPTSWSRPARSSGRTSTRPTRRPTRSRPRSASSRATRPALHALGTALRAERQLALRPGDAPPGGGGAGPRPACGGGAPPDGEDQRGHADGRRPRPRPATPRRCASTPTTSPSLQALRGIYENEQDWESYEQTLVAEAQATERVRRPRPWPSSPSAATTASAARTPRRRHALVRGGDQARPRAGRRRAASLRPLHRPGALGARRADAGRGHPQPQGPRVAAEQDDGADQRPLPPGVPDGLRPGEAGPA